MAQVQYVPHPEVITAERPILKIYWIRHASSRQRVELDHVVVFHSLRDDQLIGSKVEVKLFRNRTMISAYTFLAGDEIINRISVPKPVPLHKGDSLYFTFRLFPASDQEGFVFNIYKPEKEIVQIAESKEHPVKDTQILKDFRAQKIGNLNTSLNLIPRNNSAPSRHISNSKSTQGKKINEEHKLMIIGTVVGLGIKFLINRIE